LKFQKKNFKQLKLNQAVLIKQEETAILNQVIMTNRFLKTVLSLVAVILVSVGSFAQNPANPANPYDYVGKIHNQIVEEFLDKYAGVEMTTKEVFLATEEIAKKNKDVISRGIKIESTNPAVLDELLRDLDNDLKNVVAGLNISAAGKVKVQSFLDYLIEIGTNSTVPTYASIHSYVINFEREVQADTRLTEKDKMVIFSGTSTARYSAKLWTEKRGTSSRTTSADGRKWWGHVLVIGSDIGGAFIGGGLKDPGNAINIGGKVSNATDKYLEKEGK